MGNAESLVCCESPQQGGGVQATHDFAPQSNNLIHRFSMFDQFPIHFNLAQCCAGCIIQCIKRMLAGVQPAYARLDWSIML